MSKRVLVVEDQEDNRQILRDLLASAGIDVASFNGKGGWILPAPAVFVIDREGIVRFASVNGDYTQRVEPDQVLAALDGRATTAG